MLRSRLGNATLRASFAAALLLGIGLVHAGPMSAQDASPAAAEGMGLPPPPAGCVSIAGGLLAPRYIAIGDDGTLYVSEAGEGGDEPVLPPHSGTNEVTGASASPEAVVNGSEVDFATPSGEGDGDGQPPATRGYTGQITAIAPDGTARVLVTGLPSYSDGVGASGIAFTGGMLYALAGGTAVHAQIEPLAGEDTVFRIDPRTGERTALADLSLYEIANNPDGTDINPNLYGMTAGPDGLLYVTDTGGNAIYTVDPTTGAVALVAVVPPPAQDPTRQAVPNGIAFTADGALAISLWSENWPAGAASVLRLEPDGSFTPLTTDLTYAVALAIGPDGNTYVSELSTDLTSAQLAPGRVLRINPDGTTTVVLDGLVLPHGIAFDAAGDLYLTTVAVNLGPGAPQDEILRCGGLAAQSVGTPVP